MLYILVQFSATIQVTQFSLMLRFNSIRRTNLMRRFRIGALRSRDGSAPFSNMDRQFELSCRIESSNGIESDCRIQASFTSVYIDRYIYIYIYIHTCTEINIYMYRNKYIHIYEQLSSLASPKHRRFAKQKMEMN